MAAAYDQEPPFWFERAWLVGAPFSLLMVSGGVLRSPWLGLAGLVPLLCFMAAAYGWTTRLRVE